MSDKTDNLINNLSENLNQHKGRNCDNFWLCIAVAEDGTEGLCAVVRKGHVLPLLANDMDNLATIRKLAREVVHSDPKNKIIIRHFSNGVDVEEITA